MSESGLAARAGRANTLTNLTVLEIVGVVWARKWWVLLTSAMFALAGLAYAFLATVWYQADVVVSFSEKRPAGSAALAQLGGLAGLAGIGIGANDSSEPMAVLRSKGLVQRFIVDRHLVAELTSGPTFGVSGTADIRDAVQNFDKMVRTVSEDKKSGLVTLSIRWTDSGIASDWANALIQRANDELRSRAEQDATRNLRYLQQELASTSVLPLQQAIGRLIENEMQKAMLAKGSQEYAFRVIDPATVPKYRISPVRSLIVLSSLVLGLLVSAATVMVLHVCVADTLRTKA